MQAPAIDPARLAAATALAAEVHASQVRKGTGIPYVSHLLAVAALVLEYGGDEDQACAALLHDAIEDGGAEWEAAILDRFGPRVAAIVRACTDADVQPKPPWRARKEAYLAHLEHADQNTMLVSAADKLHNARAVAADMRAHGDEVFTRFKAGREGTLWYYGALSEVFARRMPGALADELARAVEEMRALLPRTDQAEVLSPAGKVRWEGDLDAMREGRSVERDTRRGAERLDGREG